MYWWWLLLLVSTIPACGGGGNTTPPAAKPFRIKAITPEGVAGEQGSTVTFRVGSSAPLAQAIWNFGGGTSPNTASGRVAEVTLSGSGSFTGAVVVTDSAGTSVSKSFTYAIAGVPAHPLITGLSLDGRDWGVVGEELTVTATADSPITEWTWNFGDGATILETTGNSAHIRLTARGAWFAEVSARNDRGVSFPYSQAYEVLDPGPHWTHYQLTPAWNGISPSWVIYRDRLWCFLLLPDGDPFDQFTNYTIRSLRALTAAPKTATEWSQGDVIMTDLGYTGDASELISPAVIGDRICAVVWDAPNANSRLRYLAATVETPTQLSDWASSDIDSHFIHEVGLVETLGRPLVVIPETAFPNEGAQILWAPVATPGSATDWQRLPVPAGIMRRSGFSLAERDDRLYISGYDNQNSAPSIQVWMADPSFDLSLANAWQLLFTTPASAGYKVPAELQLSDSNLYLCFKRRIGSTNLLSLATGTLQPGSGVSNWTTSDIGPAPLFFASALNNSELVLLANTTLPSEWNILQPTVAVPGGPNDWSTQRLGPQPLSAAGIALAADTGHILVLYSTFFPGATSIYVTTDDPLP